MGPQERADELGIHSSPFGVIPEVKKWCLILDLSSPDGHSVNDSVRKNLAYMSMDNVMAEVLKRGKGTLLANMDVKQAYQNIQVHPKDRHLLGMLWGGELVLPFGLRSAPLLFTAVEDALQWAMQQRGTSWVDHYIDDRHVGITRHE